MADVSGLLLHGSIQTTITTFDDTKEITALEIRNIFTRLNVTITDPSTHDGAIYENIVKILNAVEPSFRKAALETLIRRVYYGQQPHTTVKSAIDAIPLSRVDALSNQFDSLTQMYASGTTKPTNAHYTASTHGATLVYHTSPHFTDMDIGAQLMLTPLANEYFTDPNKATLFVNICKAAHAAHDVVQGSPTSEIDSYIDFMREASKIISNSGLSTTQQQFLLNAIDNLAWETIVTGTVFNYKTAKSLGIELNEVIKTNSITSTELQIADPLVEGSEISASVHDVQDTTQVSRLLKDPYYKEYIARQIQTCFGDENELMKEFFKQLVVKTTHPKSTFRGTWNVTTPDTHSDPSRGWGLKYILQQPSSKIATHFLNEQQLTQFFIFLQHLNKSIRVILEIQSKIFYSRLHVLNNKLAPLTDDEKKEKDKIEKTIPIINKMIKYLTKGDPLELSETEIKETYDLLITKLANEQGFAEKFGWFKKYAECMNIDFRDRHSSDTTRMVDDFQLIDLRCPDTWSQYSKFLPTMISFIKTQVSQQPTQVHSRDCKLKFIQTLLDIARNPLSVQYTLRESAETSRINR